MDKEERLQIIKLQMTKRKELLNLIYSSPERKKEIELIDLILELRKEID